MRKVKSWTQYFMEMVDHVATRSKDPSTQIGAVITNVDNDVLSTGYNGMPPGMIETPEIWERPTKYDYVIHGESNAILRAAKLGVAIDGGILYTTGLPCQECAKNIVASGIKLVVCRVPPADMNQKWLDSHKITESLFNKCGIRYMVFDEKYEKVYDSRFSHSYAKDPKIFDEELGKETKEEFWARVRKD